MSCKATGGFLRCKRKLTQRRSWYVGEFAPVTVMAASASATIGMLKYRNLQFPVALGRGGIRGLKKEGDGATPRGRWAVRQVYYRGDRVSRPRTAILVQRIRPADGWCDAVLDRNYNRKVPMPYAASAERLWRHDHLYDLVAVLGYNDMCRVKGRGSAIFLHVARRTFAPTAGCIAMRREHLLRLLAAISSQTAVSAGESARPSYRGRRGLR
jgi:L,D-peptidoglycan transpeptidase YkuD (ErfK/YbiS/YcfS/YnhG family)